MRRRWPLQLGGRHLARLVGLELLEEVIEVEGAIVVLLLLLLTLLWRRCLR
jgi:hypothetical protein